ncbi:MAG: nuclease [Verrucomicrobiales bacterium]|nr:nuclease [Verrucomicrobiales bacterium]
MASKKTKKTKAPAKQNSAATSGKISKFQAFTVADIHRSQWINAPYNPRHMTARAKVKLRETLKSVGLVQPLVWNKRSGNGVGGHQRISQIDALEGTADYCLTVAVIDVDDKRERELNVLLNNPEVCGDWDLEKLKEVLAFEDVELLNTGFDAAEFMKLFGEAPSNANPDHQDALAEQMRKVKEAYAKLSQSNLSKDDTDFYNVVIFASTNDRKEFLDEFGFEENRYIDGRTLTQLLRQFKVEQAKLASAGNEIDGASVRQDEPVVTEKPA